MSTVERILIAGAAAVGSGIVEIQNAQSQSPALEALAASGLHIENIDTFYNQTDPTPTPVIVDSTNLNIDTSQVEQRGDYAAEYTIDTLSVFANQAESQEDKLWLQNNINRALTDEFFFNQDGIATETKFYILQNQEGLPLLFPLTKTSNGDIVLRFANNDTEVLQIPEGQDPYLFPTNSGSENVTDIALLVLDSEGNFKTFSRKSTGELALEPVSQANNYLLLPSQQIPSSLRAVFGLASPVEAPSYVDNLHKSSSLEVAFTQDEIDSIYDYEYRRVSDQVKEMVVEGKAKIDPLLRGFIRVNTSTNKLEVWRENISSWVDTILTYESVNFPGTSLTIEFNSNEMLQERGFTTIIIDDEFKARFEEWLSLPGEGGNTIGNEVVIRLTTNPDNVIPVIVSNGNLVSGLKSSVEGTPLDSQQRWNVVVAYFPLASYPGLSQQQAISRSLSGSILDAILLANAHYTGPNPNDAILSNIDEYRRRSAILMPSIVGVPANQSRPTIHVESVQQTQSYKRDSFIRKREKSRVSNAESEDIVHKIVENVYLRNMNAYQFRGYSQNIPTDFNHPKVKVNKHK